jgi:signal transduction histidine kinase
MREHRHVRSTTAFHSTTITGLQMFAVAIAYALAASFGIHLDVRESELTPVWIPSAIALVAVLRWGPWMALGAGIGEFVASVDGGISVPGSLGLSVGNALEALVAVWLLHRLAFRSNMPRSRDVGSLVVATAVGATVSATIGVSTLVATSAVDTGEFGSQWLLFWASVTLGIILLVPLLLVWVVHPPRSWLPVVRLVEATMLAGAIVGIAFATLGASQPEYVFLLFPFLVWATMRFGIRGASATVVTLTAAALWIELSEAPHLSTLDETTTVQLLQAMLAAVAIANMLMATLLSERDAARRRAEDVADMLAEAQSVARIGSWEQGLAPDAPMRWSDQLRRMLDVDGDGDGESLDRLVERIPHEEQATVRAAIEDARHRRGTFSLEHRVRLSDGTDLVVAHAGRVVEREGARPRLVASVLDVTERSSLERLRDALIATASHELRTPLTSIVGFADTLVTRWESFSQEQRLEFLSIIRAQGRRLSSLVDDMLVQASIDSSSVTVTRHPFVVEHAIREALALTAIDGDVTVDRGPALVATGSGEQFQQVLVNLVSNAAKYGRAPFEVIARLSDDERLVEVHVRDHGEGVPDQFVPQMFERFTRGPDAGTRPGTGLGLSIVRGLVTANGGEIAYRRTDGVTDFVVTMPVWVEPADSPESVAHSA